MRGAAWGGVPNADPQTAQPMSICATTQRGSVRSMISSHELLQAGSADVVGELATASVQRRLDSALWLGRYAWPRPASPERLPRRFSCCAVIRSRSQVL